MLKPYYLEIQAARITRKNFEELEKLDFGEGVLEAGLEECLGEWFIKRASGYELWPGHLRLVPKRKQRILLTNL